MTKQMLETIAAIATPPGRGGVGVVRVSGSHTQIIAQALLGNLPKPRYAQFAQFKDAVGNSIDHGLALFFPNPHSFTGEDVLELQGHGGPVVMDLLLQRVLELGARMAKPGEFSERAFLNDKIDLLQAEAIADLIDSSTQQAARSAMRSLQGEFSAKIGQLVEMLIKLRMYVEAAIDFPEEEVDFLNDGKIAAKLSDITAQLLQVQATAQQGEILRDGITVAIVGKPNAGKSSLLNCLSGSDRAIVTEIEGTTRDLLREYIHIDGIPLHVVDTAGLRDSADLVEQEGIRRAWDVVKTADQVLLMIDIKDLENASIEQIVQEFAAKLQENSNVTVVINKIDLKHDQSKIEHIGDKKVIYLSAKTSEGLDLLKQHLKQAAGYQQLEHGCFTARRRHLDALNQANAHLQNGKQQLETYKAGELLAEDLRQAQHALGEITGEFTSDDLLGKIFSSFCIGK